VYVEAIGDHDKVSHWFDHSVKKEKEIVYIQYVLTYTVRIVCVNKKKDDN